MLGSTIQLLGGRLRGRFILAGRDLGTAQYEAELRRPFCSPL